MLTAQRRSLAQLCVRMIEVRLKDPFNTPAFRFGARRGWRCCQRGTSWWSQIARSWARAKSGTPTASCWPPPRARPAAKPSTSGSRATTLRRCDLRHRYQTAHLQDTCHCELEQKQKQVGAQIEMHRHVSTASAEGGKKVFVAISASCNYVCHSVKTCSWTHASLLSEELDPISKRSKQRPCPRHVEG